MTRDLLPGCVEARARGHEWNDEQQVFLLSDRMRIIKQLRLIGEVFLAEQIERGEHWEE
jgi:hypothetical protein